MAAMPEKRKGFVPKDKEFWVERCIIGPRDIVGTGEWVNLCYCRRGLICAWHVVKGGWMKSYPSPKPFTNTPSLVF